VDTGSKGGEDNDVIVDDVYGDGLLTVTTEGSGSDLLMQNNDSRLVLDKNFRESMGADNTEEMFFDIGGNIGAPERYFKISYEGKHDETEPAKDNLTLNIRNANDIFLTQLTDIDTEIPGGEDTGALEGELVKTEHDESISDLDDKDIQIRIYMQKNLTIAARSKSKVYDGTILEDAGTGDVTMTGLMGSHALESIEFTSGRTDVGTSSVRPRNAVIRGAGQDYYRINYVTGSLTVT